MYKKARKEAGLSIEEAAWELNVSPETLKKYEAGRLRVPPDVVLKMGETYNKPELPLHHCAMKCAIGQVYHPVFEVGNIATGTLQLQQELHDVNLQLNELIRIAADGQLSPEELPAFEVILQELIELGEVIQQLRLLGIKKLGLRKEEQVA